MDVTAAAQRRRVEARAVGRTPEEAQALERALARRRARLLHASPVSHPAQQHRPHHHPSQVEREDDGHARPQPLDARDFQGRVEDDREASLPAEVPEYLHEARRFGHIDSINMIRDGIQTPGQDPTSVPHFDYAILLAQVAAAKPDLTLPTLGVPPRRRSKPQFSMRNVRGAGWHRRGYRDRGNMWINVREGSYGHTRGIDVHENKTLTDFVKDVFHWWASKYPEGWYCDLFFRKKSVTRLLVDLENLGLDMDLVLVKDYFDGGETVYFKLFDEDGEQRSQVPFG